MTFLVSLLKHDNIMKNQVDEIITQLKFVADGKHGFAEKLLQ